MDKNAILQRLNIASIYINSLEKLKVTGDNGLALCPFHDDKNPSFSVNMLNGYYNCFACGAKGDLFRYYMKLHNCSFVTCLNKLAEIAGLKDGLQHSHRTCVATYKYYSSDGSYLYEKQRWQPGKNGRSKDFLFKNETGFGRGCPPVLYNANLLALAEIIFFTEGEKQADIINSWYPGGKYVGTTLDSGSQSAWNSEYTNYVASKQIVVLPDNDSAGRDYALKICTACQTVASKLILLELPGLPEKGDICDWAQMTNEGPSELLRLISNADIWQPVSVLITPASNASFAPILATVPVINLTSEVPPPMPMPLPADLPSVIPCNEDLLPKGLRPWLADIADRMQISPDILAVSAIVALASIIGRRCMIQPKQLDDWHIVPNLWGFVVGRPSMMKTPCIAEAFKPIHWLARKADDNFANQEVEYAFQSAVQSARKDYLKEQIKSAIKNGTESDLEALRTLMASSESEAPMHRRYLTNDATIEKLVLIQKSNNRGFLLFRDEIVSFLRTLEKTGHEADRGFFLESWNGLGSYSMDRVGRGTIQVDALCISIFGALTPGTLVEYVHASNRSGRGDDGLIQRFQLAVYPDSSSDWINVDRLPDTKARDKVYKIFEVLADEAIYSAFNNTGNIAKARFSPVAQEIFNAWRNDLELRLRSDSNLTPQLESHFAKYRKLMPSLALIFHLLEMAETNGTIGTSVSEHAALLAAAWTEYLESHAHRIYSMNSLPHMNAAKSLLRRIQAGEIKDEMSVRDIYRHHWSQLATPEQVKEALNILSEYHWLKIVQIKTDSKNSHIVKLHPSIKGGEV